MSKEYCKSCGTELIPEREFCPKCLVRVPTTSKLRMGIVKCPKCNTIIPDSYPPECPNCKIIFQDDLFKKTGQLVPIQTEPVKVKGYQSRVQEYKRTCQQCGKVWHSLVLREKQLGLQVTSDKLGACGSQMQSASTCFMCGGARAAQHQRNADANVSELDRLKSCPECRSTNYSEEILTYDK